MNQGIGRGLKGRSLKMGWGLFSTLAMAAALNACSPKASDQSTGVSQDESVGESIVGGTEVPAGNALIKSIVAVYDVSLGALCTGSLLANNIVMTAAHCVSDGSIDNMIVVFDVKLSGQSQTRRVDKAQVSPYWESNRGLDKNTGDIALIHFVGDVPAGYEAATFLPNKKSLKNDAPVILAGYGISDGKTGVGAGVLRVANVTIYDANFSVSEVKLDQTKGQGACHGDSGGPAYLFAGGKYYLWGITSRGNDDPANDCTKYSIYTNALAYKTWIKNVSKKLNSSLVNPTLALAN